MNSRDVVNEQSSMLQKAQQELVSLIGVQSWSEAVDLLKTKEQGWILQDREE